MKLTEIPQDASALQNITREVCYAKGSDGKYISDLSTGWEVKSVALDAAWEEQKRIKEEAKQLVISGKRSPIYYYMNVRLMDINILAAYTGFWRLTIRRHFKPKVFARLSNDKLRRYADIFQISVDELKNFGK